MSDLTHRAPTAEVADAINACTAPQAAQLLGLRTLIYDVAAQVSDIGPLTETLKWGEPAYLTQSSKSGTTLRIGPVRGHPDRVALFFNCQTRLAEVFRERFEPLPDKSVSDTQGLQIVGNRAVEIPTNAPLDRDQLAIMIRLVLTYHRWKGQA